MPQKPINPNQGLLFDSSRAWNDPEPSSPLEEVPVAVGSPGSYVDVEQRAKLLIESLNSFSQRNFRRTFPLAAYTSEHSSPIWARYEEFTEPVVIPGARRNAEIYDRQAALNFWRATGFTALKSVPRIEEIIRVKQIDERGIKMWDQFQDTYSRPKNRKERNQYKKKLGKFITNSEVARDVAA